MEGILIKTFRNNGEVNKEGEKGLHGLSTVKIQDIFVAEYPSQGVFGTFQKWLFNVPVKWGHWGGHFLTDKIFIHESL